MIGVLQQIYGPVVGDLARLFVNSSVVWLPIVLCYTAIMLWLYRARARWLNALEWSLIEIKLPQEVAKTPQAMEVVFTAITPPERKDLINKWIKGEQRIWTSFEIVSIGGQVHFFIRVKKDLKNRLEAAIYAQYPNVEIFEVEDYTNKVPYGLPAADWECWGGEMELVQPDAYPIKTYIEYGLEKPIDPEAQHGHIDPLISMVEFLGSIGPEEQIWIQILAMETRKRFATKKDWNEIWWQPSKWFEKQNWVKEAQKEIDKIRKADKEKEGKFILLTPGQTEVLKSIERNLGKQAFDCGIRAVHVGPKSSFSGANNGGMIGSFMQYNSAALNGFKPTNITGVTYPWQDLTGRKVALKKAVIFDAYRRRSYFYPPYVRKPFVLSAEELATIYHFPGRVATTPGLGKIESKRGEPPSNLPL